MEHERRGDDHQLHIELAQFIAEMKQWKCTTDEFRLALTAKLDDMNRRMSELPCRERKNMYDGFRSQVITLWVLITTLIVGLAISFIKHVFFAK